MNPVWLSEISSFACYYGLNRLEQLATYDLVIVQAELYSREEIMALPCQAVLGYLSLGEVADDVAQSTWVLHDAASGAVARNPRWKTTFVDCRSDDWQRFLIDVRIPALLERGVHGLFLDTVDVQDGYPETRSGVVRCLERIRECYPAAVLVVNRGFTILDAVAAVADTVVFESFTTYHDGERYVAWPEPDLAWTALMATKLRQAFGPRPILSIDYAPPGDVQLRVRAEQRARSYGFLPFVTTYALDRLP